MSKMRYTPEQIANLNRQAAAQQEQINRVQGRHESHLAQFEQAKKEAAQVYKVNSLEELRQACETGLNEINRAVDNLVAHIDARQKVLDELEEKRKELS